MAYNHQNKFAATVQMICGRRALVFCSLCAIMAVADKMVTPEQFGAKGNGQTDDTAAVRAALSSCVGNNEGTCTILFSSGEDLWYDMVCLIFPVVIGKTYLSGPLIINSSDTTLDFRGKLSMLPRERYLTYNDTG